MRDRERCSVLFDFRIYGEADLEIAGGVSGRCSAECESSADWVGYEKTESSVGGSIGESQSEVSPTEFVSLMAEPGGQKGAVMRLSRHDDQ